MQPDTAPTIKPCPLCGTSDGVTIGPSRAGGLHWHNIECHGCCLYITGNTEAEAIAAWNTRASQPTACTECERLAEALEKIAKATSDEPDAGEVDRVAWQWLDGMVSSICDEEPADIAYSADQMVDAYTAGALRAQATARSALASHAVRLIDGGEG